MSPGLVTTGGTVWGVQVVPPFLLRRKGGGGDAATDRKDVAEFGRWARHASELANSWRHCLGGPRHYRRSPRRCGFGGCEGDVENHRQRRANGDRGWRSKGETGEHNEWPAFGTRVLICRGRRPIPGLLTGPWPRG